MYFYNGFVAGLVTGLTCCMLMVFPSQDDMAKNEAMSNTSGFYTGLVAGIVTAGAVLWFIISKGVQ